MIYLLILDRGAFFISTFGIEVRALHTGRKGENAEVGICP